MACVPFPAAGKRLNLLRWLCIGAAPVLLMGCPGELGDAQQFRYQTSCALDVERDVLQKSCATAFCHDELGAPVAGGLDFSKPNPADQLYGVPAKNADCRSRGYPYRIDPKSGRHLLLHLLNETQPVCSLPMPQQGQRLTPEESECVQQWVDALVAEGGSRAPGNSAPGAQP
jgi:hypothetical protein